MSNPYAVYLVQYYSGHNGHRRRPNHLHIVVDTSDGSRDPHSLKCSEPLGTAFFLHGSLAQGYRLVRKEGYRYCKVNEYRGRVLLGTLDPHQLEEVARQLRRVEIRNYDPLWCHRQDWALAAYRRLVAQEFSMLYLGTEALLYRLREAEENWEQGDD